MRITQWENNMVRWGARLPAAVSLPVALCKAVITSLVVSEKNTGMSVAKLGPGY